MEKLNELVELAKEFDASTTVEAAMAINSQFKSAATRENILAIAEAFRALEQRAEAAEAKLSIKDRRITVLREQRDAETIKLGDAEEKLAELEKQPAIAWLNTREGDPTWPRVFVTEEKAAANREWVTLAPMVKTQPLFTRPAPAADLAELVPEEMTPKLASRSYGGQVEGYRDGFNACRSAILRNIEEAE